MWHILNATELQNVIRFHIMIDFVYALKKLQPLSCTHCYETHESATELCTKVLKAYWIAP